MTVRRHAIIATGIGGAGLLGASLSRPPGSRRFYLLATGLAGTWTAGALRYQHHGSTPLVVLIGSSNAVAEELFFRGALRALVADSHPVIITTLAYAAAATATTDNPALMLAGIATSVLFGLQRRSWQHPCPGARPPDLVAPLLRYLPPVFRAPGEPGW